MIIFFNSLHTNISPISCSKDVQTQTDRQTAIPQHIVHFSFYWKCTKNVVESRACENLNYWYELWIYDCGHSSSFVRKGCNMFANQPKAAQLKEIHLLHCTFLKKVIRNAKCVDKHKERSAVSNQYPAGFRASWQFFKDTWLLR